MSKRLSVARAAVWPLALGSLLAGLLGGCSTSAPAVEPTVALTGSSPSATAPLLAPQDPGSTVGGLAPGFPATLLVVPTGAQILVSSVEPATGGLVQISLNLRSELATATLLDDLSAPLVAAGFARSTPPLDAGLAAQAAFSRADGKELLVLGIRDDGTTRTVSIGGAVATSTAG